VSSSPWGFLRTPGEHTLETLKRVFEPCYNSVNGNHCATTERADGVVKGWTGTFVITKQ
jgi:hypothetical protein